MGEVLEQRVLPPDVWMKDISQLVRCAPELILAQKGPTLLPLGEEQMEVEGGAMLVQEDGAAVENSSMVEQAP